VLASRNVVAGQESLRSREIHIHERMISEVMTSFADSVADWAGIWVR
jgi:hypothetical protein